MKITKKKLSTLYKKFAIIGFNTVLLFVLINIVFYFIPSPIQKRINFFNSLHSLPAIALKTDTVLLKKVYEGLTMAEISERVHAPQIKSHPVLPFMNQPTENSCYKLGFENIRYDSFIKSDSVAKQKINNSVWVFGGSTVFGTGVCGDETITYYLNIHDSVNTYINFGCQGYNQFAEIEKLVLLLRKGYTPKTVVFLDGLNDLGTLSHYCFSALETPARSQHAYEHELGPDNIKLSRKSIYSLPVLNWYMGYVACKTTNGSLPIEEDIYSPGSDYNTSDYRHYLSHRLYLHAPDEKLKDKMLTYYRNNLAFIQKLSEAYHFDYHIFFQPIGTLFAKNPFIKNKVAFDSAFFAIKQSRYLEAEMRRTIKTGNLNHFIDLSQTHYQTAMPYIDLTHYSPKMNLLMAKKILESMVHDTCPPDRGMPQGTGN